MVPLNEDERSSRVGALVLLLVALLAQLDGVCLVSAQGTRLSYNDSNNSASLPSTILINESVTDVDLTLEGSTANATWSPSVNVVVRVVDWQFIAAARQALRINITRSTRLRNVAIVVEGLSTSTVATNRSACSAFPAMRALQVHVHDIPSSASLNPGVAYMATLQVRHAAFCGSPGTAVAGLQFGLASPDPWSVVFTNVEVSNAAIDLAPRAGAAPGNALVKIVPPLSLRRSSVLQLLSLPDITVVLEEPSSGPSGIAVESQSTWLVWNCTLRSALASGATGISNNLLQVSSATASKISLAVTGASTGVNISNNRCSSSSPQGSAGLLCGLNLRWSWLQVEAGGSVSIVANVLSSVGVAPAGAVLFSRWEALVAMEVAGDAVLSNQAALRIASNTLSCEYRCLRVLIKGRLLATNTSRLDVSRNVIESSSVSGAPGSAQTSSVVSLAVWGAIELGGASAWTVEANRVEAVCGVNTVTTWGPLLLVQLGPSVGTIIVCKLGNASQFTISGNVVLLGEPFGSSARAVADSLLTIFASYALIQIAAGTVVAPPSAFAVSAQNLTAMRSTTIKSGGLTVLLASVSTAASTVLGGGVVVANNIVVVDAFDAAEGSTPMALLYCRVAQTVAIGAMTSVALTNNRLSTNTTLFSGSRTRSPMYGLAVEIGGATTVDGDGAELTMEGNSVSMSSASTVAIAVMLSLNYEGGGTNGGIVRLKGLVAVRHNVVHVLNVTGVVPQSSQRSVVGGVLLGTPRGGTLWVLTGSRLIMFNNTVASIAASLPSNTPFSHRSHVACGICIMATVGAASSATSAISVQDESRLSVDKNVVTALVASNLHAIGVLCFLEASLSVSSSSVVEILNHKLLVALTSTVVYGFHVAAGICTAPSPTGVAVPTVTPLENGLVHAMSASSLTKVTANTMDVSVTSSATLGVVEGYGVLWFATWRIVNTSRCVIAVNSITLATQRTLGSALCTALRVLCKTSTAGVAAVWLQTSSRFECTDNTVVLAADGGTTATTSTATVIVFSVSASSTMVAGGAPGAVTVDSASMLSLSRNVLRKLRALPNTTTADTAAKSGVEWTITNNAGMAMAIWRGSLVSIEDNNFLTKATSGTAAATYISGGTFANDVLLLSFSTAFATTVPPALLQASGDALATSSPNLMGAAGLAMSLGSTLGVRRNHAHGALGTFVGIDCNVAFAGGVDNPTCIAILNNSALDVSENDAVLLGGNALHVSAQLTHGSYAGSSVVVSSMTVAGSGSSVTVAANRWLSQGRGVLLMASAPIQCYQYEVCYPAPTPHQGGGGGGDRIDAGVGPGLDDGGNGVSPTEANHPEPPIVNQGLVASTQDRRRRDVQGADEICETYQECDSVRIDALVTQGATMALESNVITATGAEAVRVAFADSWTFDGTGTSLSISSNYLSGTTGAVRWRVPTTSFKRGAFGRVEKNLLAVSSEALTAASCIAMFDLSVAAAPSVLALRRNKCTHAKGGAGSFASWALTPPSTLRIGSITMTCDIINRRTLVDATGYGVFVTFGTITLPLEPTALIGNCTTFSTTRSPPSPTLSRPRRGVSKSVFASASESAKPPTRTPTRVELPSAAPPTPSVVISTTASMGTASPSTTRRRTTSAEPSISTSVERWTASSRHTPSVTASFGSPSAVSSRSVSSNRTASTTPTRTANSKSLLPTFSASLSTSCDPFFGLQRLSPLFNDFRVAPEAHAANDYHPSLPAEGVLPGVWGAAVDALVVEKLFLFEVGAAATTQRAFPVLLARVPSPYRVNLPLDMLRNSGRVIGNGTVMVFNGSAAFFRVGQWSPTTPFNDGDTLEVRFVLNDILAASTSQSSACDPTATFPLAYVRLGAPLSSIQQSVRDAMGATSIVALVFQLLTGDGGGDLQTMILVGMMECTPKGGALQNSLGNLKTLAPLLLEESFVGVIWGNLLLVGGVAVVQGVAMLMLWVWRRATGTQTAAEDGATKVATSDALEPSAALDNVAKPAADGTASHDPTQGTLSNGVLVATGPINESGDVLEDWWPLDDGPTLNIGQGHQVPSGRDAFDDVMGWADAIVQPQNNAPINQTLCAAGGAADVVVVGGGACVDGGHHTCAVEEKQHTVEVAAPESTVGKKSLTDEPLVYPIPVAVAFPGMVISAAVYAFQGTLFAGVRLVQLYQPGAALTDDVAADGQRYRFAAGLAVVLCLLPLPLIVWRRLSNTIHRSYHQYPMSLGDTRDAFDLKYRIFTSLPAMEVSGVMLPSTLGRQWGPLVAACRPGGLWMAMPLASGWMMCVAALLQFKTSTGLCSAIVFALAVANGALAVVVAIYRPRRSRFLNVAAAIQLMVNAVTLLVNAASLQDPKLANQQLLAGLGFSQTILSAATTIGTLAVVLSTKFQRDRKGFLQLVWAIGPLCPEASTAEADLEARRRLVEGRCEKLRRVMRRLGYTAGRSNGGESVDEAVRRAKKAYLKNLKHQQKKALRTNPDGSTIDGDDDDDEPEFADAVDKSLRARSVSMGSSTTLVGGLLGGDVPAASSVGNDSSADILRSFAFMQREDGGVDPDDPVLATLMFSPPPRVAANAAASSSSGADNAVAASEDKDNRDASFLL